MSSLINLKADCEAPTKSFILFLFCVYQTIKQGYQGLGVILHAVPWGSTRYVLVEGAHTARPDSDGPAEVIRAKAQRGYDRGATKVVLRPAVGKAAGPPLHLLFGLTLIYLLTNNPVEEIK